MYSLFKLQQLKWFEKNPKFHPLKSVVKKKWEMQCFWIAIKVNVQTICDFCCAFVIVMFSLLILFDLWSSDLMLDWDHLRMGCDFMIDSLMAWGHGRFHILWKGSTVNIANAVIFLSMTFLMIFFFIWRAIFWGQNISFWPNVEPSDLSQNGFCVSIINARIYIW